LAVRWEIRYEQYQSNTYYRETRIEEKTNTILELFEKIKPKYFQTYNIKGKKLKKFNYGTR
jgi:hypothetical protein